MKMFGGVTGRTLPCLSFLVLLILSLLLATLDLKRCFSTECYTVPSFVTVTNMTRHFGDSNSIECELPLKVYMYDLPRRFNLGMFKKNSSHQNLPWTSSKIPPWPQRSGLKKQHSVEYWMMVYLLDQRTVGKGERAAVRVMEPNQADVFFVPFFASLSFNVHGQTMRDPETECDKKLQIEVVEMLRRSKWWQRSGGRDHVIVVHHPNAFRFLRDEVNASIFVVADFGRNPRNVSSLSKDVVAPYAHVVDSYMNDDPPDPFESRRTLLFFRGRTKRKDEGIVRLKLARILGNHKSVHFEDSVATNEGFEVGSDAGSSSNISNEGTKMLQTSHLASMVHCLGPDHQVIGSQDETLDEIGQLKWEQLIHRFLQPCGNQQTCTEDVESVTDPELLQGEHLGHRAIQYLLRIYTFGNISPGTRNFSSSTRISRSIYAKLKIDEPKPGQELAGLWSGIYGPHSMEIITVSYSNENIIATKLLGDPNVPAGEITFMATISSAITDTRADFPPGQEDGVDISRWYRGRGRIADHNFENPEWVPGRLLVQRNGNMAFVWEDVNFVIRFKRFNLE